MRAYQHSQLWLVNPVEKALSSRPLSQTILRRALAPVIFAEIFYDYNGEEATENGGAIASGLLTTTIILGMLKLIVTTFVLFEVSANSKCDR